MKRARNWPWRLVHLRVGVRSSALGQAITSQPASLSELHTWHEWLSAVPGPACSFRLQMSCGTWPSGRREWMRRRRRATRSCSGSPPSRLPRPRRLRWALAHTDRRWVHPFRAAAHPSRAVRTIWYTSCGRHLPWWRAVNQLQVASTGASRVKAVARPGYHRAQLSAARSRSRRRRGAESSRKCSQPGGFQARAAVLPCFELWLQSLAITPASPAGSPIGGLS